MSGLCELIERDAFMLTWLHRRAPQRIKLESISFQEAELSYRYFVERGFVVHFLNLTSDLGLPTILSLIEHPELPWDNAVVLGLGCALDPHVALRKAFLEAIVMLSNHASIDDSRSEIRVQRRQLPYGLQAQDYFAKVRFLLAGTSQIHLNDLPTHDRRDSGRNLEFVLQRLLAAGHEVYFADLTPPEYARSRICLTRAFVTGLQPMLYEPDCWRLVPQRLFGANPPTFDRLNLMPHPFMLME